MQSRDAAAYRAVPAESTMILVHMVMNGGKCKTKCNRHWVMAKAGRQGMARQNKAVVAKRAGGEADRHRPWSKHSRQMKLAGTGLAVKQPTDDPTGTGLAVKTAGR